MYLPDVKCDLPSRLLPSISLVMRLELALAALSSSEIPCSTNMGSGARLMLMSLPATENIQIWYTPLGTPMKRVY